VVNTSHAPAPQQGMGESLQGKVVAVTGASGGIGRALAETLVLAGAQLFLAAGPGEEENVADFSDRAFVTGVDITNEASLVHFTDLIGQSSGRLDGLVTLAGVMEQVSFDDLTDDIWEQTLRINLTGTYRTIRASLPLLRRPATASVVTMSSQLAYTGAPNTIAYSASKAGVLGLTRALARELGPRIRVNSVAPGPVATAMTAVHAETPGWVEAKTSRQVMPRFAEPHEITGPIRFLLSEESSFMTGQSMSVNGGGAMP
jgi:3-oxoacyl-[acyl-carrier protein] reductase